MMRHDRTRPPAPHAILVVEDDPLIQKLLVATLRRQGLSVEVASGGEQALALLNRRRYAVVLTDLMMPGVSGFDVIRWMGENPEHRPKSLIVVTAAGRNVLPQLDESVVNAVVLKPFDVSALARYVRATADRGLDRRRLRLIT